MKNFALIGASGYIAPRHMKAIKETGNDLVVAMDTYDGIGIMDSNFPQADFFTEFERFSAFVDSFKRDGNKIDYMAITTPNYLHDSHIRFALKSGSNAICEKPLVLNPNQIDALKVKISKELEKDPSKVYDIDLTYLTSRGKWYFESWKGHEAKSGGIASNIGVHFFDMLSWIFGELKENIVYIKNPDANAGFMKLKNANVRWFLSVNYNYIPEDIKATGKTTFRSITVDGEEFEFSEGFTDLHTKSYQDILNGGGFGLDDAKNSIVIVSDIRKMNAVPLDEKAHLFCKKVLG